MPTGHDGLELRIPPMIVLVLLGAVMWSLASLSPELQSEYAGRVPLAIAIALVGTAVVLAALREFKRHQTTPDPTRPETSTAVVRSGIYRFSRNPMYLGMLLWLIAWAVKLSNPIAPIGPIVFVLYMNRFQIAPEERTLAQRFGAPYEEYLRSVRRWI